MTGAILCRDMNGHNEASVVSNPLSDSSRKKERRILSGKRERARQQTQVLTVFVTDSTNAVYDAVATTTSSSSVFFTGPTTNTGANMHVTSRIASCVVIERETTGSPNNLCYPQSTTTHKHCSNLIKGEGVDSRFCLKKLSHNPLSVSKHSAAFNKYR